MAGGNIVRRQYCGLKVMQRTDPQAVSFFVFVARPSDIVQWVAVDRIEDREGGIQRRVSEARLRAMRKFFTVDSRNIIPTSIVLAFPPEIGVFTPFEMGAIGEECDNQADIFEWGMLSFQFDTGQPETDRPAFVVDGQHRLFSMAGLKEEDPPILVSALLQAGPNEQAFQFVVINNKVNKVPPDLVRSLIVDLREEELQKRLETARVSLQPQAILVGVVDDEPESPLYEMVRWERRRGTGNPSVNPAAIEDSLKHIRRRFPILDEDEDALIDFFFALWQGVKDSYPELWGQTDNRLFSNAGFKAFSEYLTDEIETLANILYVRITNLPAVTKTSATIAAQINVEFWKSEWKLKSLDTSAGRDIIKEDLRRIRRNSQEDRTWSEGLALVVQH